MIFRTKIDEKGQKISTRLDAYSLAPKGVLFGVVVTIEVLVGESGCVGIRQP